MTEAVRLAYAEGFIAKCAEAGLDPEKIAQDAQTGATAGMQMPKLQNMIPVARPVAQGAQWLGKATAGMQMPKLQNMIPVAGLVAQGAQWLGKATAGMQNPFAKTGEDGLRDAYAQGFMRKCAERGVDPKKVVQAALGNSPTRTGAYTAAALNPLTSGLSAPIYAGAKSDSVGKGVGNMFATPIAMTAGAVPGVALMGMGRRQLVKAVRPVISMASGARVGHAVVDAARYAGGKGKIIAGLIAALTGAGIAGGETTYALSKRR